MVLDGVDLNCQQPNYPLKNRFDEPSGNAASSQIQKSAD